MGIRHSHNQDLTLDEFFQPFVIKTIDEMNYTYGNFATDDQRTVIKNTIVLTNMISMLMIMMIMITVRLYIYSQCLF